MSDLTLGLNEMHGLPRTQTRRKDSVCKGQFGKTGQTGDMGEIERGVASGI